MDLGWVWEDTQIGACPVVSSLVVPLFPIYDQISVFLYLCTTRTKYLVYLLHKVRKQVPELSY